jgi:D-alanyl-D-alanine carboxypeptidase
MTIGTRMRLGLALVLVALLAGCAGGGRYSGGGNGLATAPARYYRPPGPPGDPWGPYVDEAARRFGLPAHWIRAVMRQESGGQQQAVSPVGAMGLMQLMPQTYAGLRDRYGLGGDPFEPRDNIMAGTAYLREMYDRFGAPGFLAAYNAGPQRVDDYLASGESLPEETTNYLLALAPQLGPDTQMTGPLAAYAGNAAEAAPVMLATAAPTQRSFASGCDSDAAYDPDHPCHALERVASAPAPTPPVVLASAAAPRGGWAIQVGAFTSASLARSIAQRAEEEEPVLLGGAAISVPPTSPFGGSVLYRARLVALSQSLADLACQRLNAQQLPCIVVRPGESA